MEADHHVKLKEETKRIKAEQERAHHKFQDQMKHNKKEVILRQREEKKIFCQACWRNQKCVLLFIFLNLFLGQTVCW